MWVFSVVLGGVYCLWEGGPPVSLVLLEFGGFLVDRSFCTEVTIFEMMSVIKSTSSAEVCVLRWLLISSISLVSWVLRVFQ